MKIGDILCWLGFHKRETRLIQMTYGQAWEDWCPRCNGRLAFMPFLGQQHRDAGDGKVGGAQ